MFLLVSQIEREHTDTGGHKRSTTMHNCFSFFVLLNFLCLFETFFPTATQKVIYSRQALFTVVKYREIVLLGAQGGR